MIAKRKKVTRVQMYFDDATLPIYKELQEVARASGFSQSEVAYIAFATGFPMVKDGILKLTPNQLAKLPKKSRAKAK
jgi:hypothetical protein